MTHNHPQSSKDNAELARWLWPHAVNLDWDGRVTVKRSEGHWETFSPQKDLNHCIRALPVLRGRGLVGAMLEELEIQLHKLRRVRPRVGLLPEEESLDVAPKRAAFRFRRHSLRFPTWLEHYIFSLCDGSDEPGSVLHKPQDNPAHSPSDKEEWLSPFVKALGKDPKDVAKILSDTIDMAIKNHDNPEGRKWMAEIVRRWIFDGRPRQRRSSATLSIHIFQIMDQKHIFSSVLAAIERLPSDTKKVFLLHRMGGLKPSEIASKLKMELGAVSRLLEEASLDIRESLRRKYREGWRHLLVRKIPAETPGYSQVVDDSWKAIVNEGAANPYQQCGTDSDKAGEGKAQCNQDAALLVRIAIQKQGGGAKVSGLISRWLQLLTDAQQKVFLLHYFADMQPVEIGATLQASVEQVDWELRTCWQSIMKELRKTTAHDVLLSQVMAALLAVARKDALQMRGEA